MALTVSLVTLFWTLHCCFAYECRSNYLAQQLHQLCSGVGNFSAPRVGKAGPPGRIGLTGPSGLKGEIGPQGPVGIQGIPGEAIVGPRGLKGEVGPQGPVGIQGIRGPPGIGLRGLKGEVGPQGPAGSQGIRGPIGVGLRGLKGEVGQPGPVGVQGIPGPKGRAGPPGPTGRQGVTGYQGYKGYKGDRGPRGVFNMTEVERMADRKILETAKIVMKPVEKTIKIRLRGGSLTRGRVEVYYDRIWGTICHDYFDWRDANVACKQLGFRRASTYYSNAHFGQGNGKIWLDDLACDGTEESLWDCSGNYWGSHNCYHSRDVGVDCVI